MPQPTEITQFIFGQPLSEIAHIGSTAVPGLAAKHASRFTAAKSQIPAYASARDGPKQRGRAESGPSETAGFLFFIVAI
jgi:hypothetical protein